MEAKIDVRKLQLLNDRICQTIDALNEVRASVRGLSHSSYQGFAGYPQVTPFGLQQQVPPWALGPQQAPFIGQQGLGLQHTPWSTPATLGQTPHIPQAMYGPGLLAQQQQLPVPQQSINPWLGWGLGHSSADLAERQLSELRAGDPTRLQQTFPLAGLQM